MIVIAGTATAKIEDRDATLKAIQEMVTASEAEPGCVSYRIYLDPADDSRFFIFEEWESEAALQHHFQQAHMQTFGAFLASVQAQTKIKRYDVAQVTALDANGE